MIDFPSCILFKIIFIIMIIIIVIIITVVVIVIVRVLKQPRRRRQQERHKFAYSVWKWKTVVLHALHVHFSFFHIPQTFSFFSRREMTCFAVVWTTWAYVEKCFIFWSTASNLLSVMTWNNWEMIAETQIYIFRWCSCCRRLCVCLGSLFSPSSWTPVFYLPFRTTNYM